MLSLKEYLKTTPRYINLLAENGIKTIRDFFMYFPRAYEDRKNMVLLADIQSEQVIYTVRLHLLGMTIIKTAK
jgi:RecG-like helicase